MQPDIYASVDLERLKTLKGIDELGRDELNIMLPNPVDEGIMTFYAKRVLQNYKLWDMVSGGKECKSSDPIPNVHIHLCERRDRRRQRSAIITVHVSRNGSRRLSADAGPAAYTSVKARPSWQRAAC